MIIIIIIMNWNFFDDNPDNKFDETETCTLGENTSHDEYGVNSKSAALKLPQRTTELIGIQRVITNEKGNKSHMSITFSQHSLKRHSPRHPASSLWNALIVILSDACTLRIAHINYFNSIICTAIPIKDLRWRTNCFSFYQLLK